MALDPMFDIEKMFEIVMNDERTKNNQFIQSLHTGYKQYGSLTEKQMAKFLENFDKFFDRDGNPLATQTGGQFKFVAKNTLGNLYRNTPEPMKEKTKMFCQWYLAEYEKFQSQTVVTTQEFNTQKTPQPDLMKGVFEAKPSAASPSLFNEFA